MIDSTVLVDRTAEAVGCGHPDRFCDLAVSAVLEHCLAHDPCALVNVECSLDWDAVSLSGVLHIRADMLNVDFEAVVAQLIDRCGLGCLKDGSRWAFRDRVLRAPRAIAGVDAVSGRDSEISAVDQVGRPFEHSCRANDVACRVSSSGTPPTNPKYIDAFGNWNTCRSMRHLEMGEKLLTIVVAVH